MSKAGHPKLNGLRVYVPTSSVKRCVECEQPITGRSNYTFSCSKDCAADWADDEALTQVLKKQKKKAAAKP